jgi:outer membrane protein with beta-barrel domain
MVCGLSSSRSAFADEISYKTQFSLGVGILSFTTSTVDFDVAGVSDQEVTDTAFGTLDSSSVGFGYAMSDSIVLGASISASYQKQSAEDVDDSSGGSVALTPTIQYYFPGQSARVFVGAGLGLVLGSTDDGDVKTSSTAVGLTGTVGVAWFATESVSIAPNLSLGYAWGSSDFEGDGFEEDADIRVFGVDLGLTLSAWL